MRKFHTREISIFLLLIFFLFNTSIAVPKVTHEITTNTQGKLLVKSVTPGIPGPVSEIPVPASPQTDEGVIWTTDDPIAIANNVTISGNGAAMLTGWYLNSERTSRYDITGTGIPNWEYSQTPNFYIPVAASDNGNVLASAGDIIPLNCWLNGAGPNPSWQSAWSAGYLGRDVDVSDDGTYIVGVCQLEGGTTGRIRLFNASSSTVIGQVDFDCENGINGIEISEDNNWIVVSTYYTFQVYNRATMTLLYSGPNYSQTQAGINADASWLGMGDFNGLLHVYQRIGNAYVEQWSNSMGGWVTAVDISADGSTVLAGNFEFTPGYDGEVRAFDINGTLLWTYSQYGDYVSSVALCNDGSVGVAGSWGELDATFGDVFTAFDVETGGVIVNLLDDIDEPGTIFQVDVSDDGSYAVCGGKSVHARTFGNGGQVYSIELVPPGPFDITVTMTPENPPINIPANGGSFNFNIAVANLEGAPASCDVWTMATLPNGSEYGPIINTSLNMPTGFSGNRDRTQAVPASAPAGAYTYDAYVGNFPNNIWDEDHFPFTKSAADDGGTIVQGWGVRFTDNSGDDEFLTSVTPAEFRLSQNYPNPFNPVTTIDFYLSNPAEVELTVFNIMGEEIGKIYAGFLSEGDHSFDFRGDNLTSGIYFYKLTADGFIDLKKMILLK